MNPDAHIDPALGLVLVAIAWGILGVIVWLEGRAS